MKFPRALLVVSTAGLAGLTAVATSRAQVPQGAVDPQIVELFKPLPKSFVNDANPLSEAKVTLGRMLFYDARLSKNHDVSCNSCHDLAGFGVDGKPVSDGHRGQKGGRNSPTAYNAGGHIAQFWDGRAATLEEQAKGPIMNPVEMAMPSEKRLLATMNSIPEYVALFKKAFPGEKRPVSYDNVGKAIAAFERGLVTPGRFDAFLAGNKTALSDREKRGLHKFYEYGCTTCHNGAAVGGASFQRLGLVTPFETKDDGRFAVTKQEGDRRVFRVASLRNIDKTGPYLHDGSVKEVSDVVKLMARHQLGKEMPAADVDAVVAFLKALTGEIPADYIKKPQLPASTARTPKPDPS